MFIDEDGWLDQALRMPSQHHGGEITPLVVVDHWTAGGAASGSVHALDVQGLSAHFVAARDGSLIQTLPCHIRGWHAGESSWRGRSGVSGFSVGIEWCNYGPLTRKPSGGFLTAYGSTHHGGVEDVNGTYWEPLTPEQLATGHKLHRALAERYPTIVEAVDHNAIAPNRKIDMVPWKAIVADWGRFFAGRDAPLPPTPPAEREPRAVHVRAIQQALNKAGARLVVDGVVGAKTTAAIIAFQREHGLLHVGVVNDETKDALGL